MRAGLFGGTFNPIHKGHLMVAEKALRDFSLDRIYIIPCREPPHKHPAYLAPTVHRIQMIRLAMPSDARYQLSEVEVRRSGPSYTVDTVNRFRTGIVPGAALFLVMGMDAFLEIHTWKSWALLLETVQPVVVTRTVNDGWATDGQIRRMDGYIRSRLSDAYRYVESHTCWQLNDKSSIHLLTTAPVEVSSSQIRQRIREGDAINDLVPPPVGAYIEQKELYR